MLFTKNTYMAKLPALSHDFQVAVEESKPPRGPLLAGRHGLSSLSTLFLLKFAVHRPHVPEPSPDDVRAQADLFRDDPEESVPLPSLLELFEPLIVEDRVVGKPVHQAFLDIRPNSGF